MTTYRAGVIGLGQVGMLYELDERTARRYASPSHTSAYAASTRMALVAGCDVSADRLATFRARYPGAAAYDAYDEMLRRARLDVVSVCVGPDLQAAVVRAAADAGVRLIFCEKPLGVSADEAEAVAAHCAARGVGLAVNYWRRFDESHRDVAQLIGEGRIGSIQRFHGYFGNGWPTNGSHLVNLLLWYGGAIERVTARIEAAEADRGDAIVEFANGARATLSSVSYRAYRLLELDVIGTTGRIALRNEGLDIAVYGVQPNEEVTGSFQLEPTARRIPSRVTEAFPAAIATLARWLDARVRPEAADAIDTLRVLDAVQQSAAAGGRTVAVPAGSAARPGAV